jgi:hypothetical protein
MKKTIICLSAAFLLCGPAAYSQTIAWVFWRYLEVVNVKGEASGWSVEDAFEDIKSCKAAAEKAGQGIARAMKEELLELNAGFWLMKSTKDPPFQSTTYKCCVFQEELIPESRFVLRVAVRKAESEQGVVQKGC